VAYKSAGYWKIRNDPRVVGKGRRKSSTTVAQIITDGHESAPATDFTGNPRPIPNPGGTYDIGAYQYASGVGEEGKWPYWCVSTRDVSVGTGWTLEGAGTIGEAVNGDPTVDTNAVYATTATTGDTFTVGLSAWPSNWPQSPIKGGTRKRFPREE
jgi:hypothetical protein